VTRWNNRREAGGLPRVCSPRDGLNISVMVDNKIRDLVDRCRAEDEVIARGETPGKKMYPAQRKMCRDEISGIDTLAHCRSADHLLASPQYDKHYRSMFKALMGRFHRGQKFTNGELLAIGRLFPTRCCIFFASEEYSLSHEGEVPFICFRHDDRYCLQGHGVRI
jgi:hypothetical protein